MLELIVKFKDGENVTMYNWENWTKDYDGANDIIELFERYRKENKEMTFKNPDSGLVIKRFANDLKSIEFKF